MAVENPAEQRLAPRIPWETELKALFAKSQAPVIAKTTNISPAGLEFNIPWQSQPSRVGEEVMLSFDLPGRGPINVQVMICHERLAETADRKQAIYYGAKFVDLNPEHWRLIRSYCQERIAAADSEMRARERQSSESLCLTRKMRKGRPNNLEVLVNLHPNDGRIITGRIEEAGFAGFEILVQRLVEPGTLLKIRIRHEQIRLDLNGECLWHRPSAHHTQHYVIGVRIKVQTREQFEMLRDLILRLVRAAS